jgi:PAS domain S-box-containing protein
MHLSPRARGEVARPPLALAGRVLGLPASVRYGTAVIAVVVATLLRLALEPVLVSRLPFTLFYPAIMVSAWAGGLGPGIVATVLSGVAASYFWVPPPHSWKIQDGTELLGVLTFVGVGLLISALNEAWRRGAARLVEAEGRLRVTLGSIGDAVVTTDEEGRVTRLNAVAQALVGASEAEAVGRPLGEVLVLVDEESRRPVENPVQKVLRDGVVSGLANHTLLLSRDGREIPIDDSAAPIEAPDGSIEGVVLVFRDVSERRGAEREMARQREAEHAARLAAEAAERKLGLALEAGRMGVWRWMLDTGRLQWSPGLEAIHGYAPGTFPGTFDAFRAEIHAEDRERVLAAIQDALEKRAAHHIEYRIVRADGAVRWVEARGQVVVAPGGRPERMIGVCQDVTERRLAEERFRLAVEAAPAAMLMVDGRGTIVLVNALTERLLGYSRDELLGQPIDRLVPPSLRARHAEFRSGFIAEARARPMGAGRDLHALRKDGAEVPVEIGLSPIDTAEGRFVLAAVTDITARKDAERKVQEADRRKDEFLAMLAHELRNPLGAITSAAQLLKQLGPPEGNLRWARDVIDRQAAHLARIVDDLLDVSRISCGQVTVLREPMPLAEAIALAVETTRPLFESRRQTLTSFLPPDPIWLDADATRLAQVIGNLLSNASRYSAPGGVVSLSVRGEGPEAVVRVRDHGVGIAPEMLARVFDPFVQAERSPASAPGGLGLGLTLARRLIELHGGQIEARSAGLGQGSEFVVRLPALAGEPPARAKAPRMAEESREALRRRILVVDDNADSRDSLALMLAIAGHAVRLAGDGPAALAEAAEFHPEVALLDIGLPGMDGYQLARRLKSQSVPGGIVLVALSGYGQDEDRRRGRESGFDHYLVKPASAEAILSVLGRPGSGASRPRPAADGN